MFSTTVRSLFSRNALRRVGRALALVAQLAVLLAPLAEVREERALGAHVEGPRTTAHPGHRPDSCPACILISMHGRPAERARLDTITPQPSQVPPAEPAFATLALRPPSNSSRAPPRAL
jgi:hypothetical protein